MRRFAFVLCLVLLTTVGVLTSSDARAGTGPETTLVVVNAESPSSLQVANAYARLRDIPANHLLYLDGIPAEPVVTIDVFRQRILQPIEAYLAAEGLQDDITTIAYSVGFPYGVNFDAEVKAKEYKPGRGFTRTASLTGLTFFYRAVLDGDPATYLDLQGNGYFRRPEGAGERRQPTGEERRLIADARGAMRSKDYRRAAEALGKLTEIAPEEAPYWYDLACCLALTDKPDEAMAALEKAVEHGFSQADHARGDPDLESLRERPGFGALLKTMSQAKGIGVQGARGFRANEAWTGAADGDAEAPADSKNRYRLAVMLGWTGRYGNTVDEVLRCLEQSAASDQTHPRGSVYMMVNQDQARSGPRRQFFQGTIDALERLGRKGVVLEQGQDGQDGKIPRGKDDVMGIVAGIAGFSWGKQDPELLPGALAEHLTSFGAHFGTAGQTKVTEFVRHGAAGTCGTVAEPLNVWQKFPTPYLHAHYAQGCAMAEAFYQSIFGPYQQLILGDPLARPFARFADVRLTEPDPTTPWSGVVEVKAEATAPVGHSIDSVELWIDGRKVAEAPPGKPLPWDTTKLDDGAHEVRVVAVDGGPIGTRAATRLEVTVANKDASIEVTCPAGSVPYGEDVLLKVKGDDLEGAEAYRGAALVATATRKGSTWRLEIPSARLGRGTSRISVRATSRDGTRVRAPVVVVHVEATAKLRTPAVVDDSLLLPGLFAALTDADGGRREGVLGTLNGGPGRQVQHDLTDLGLSDPEGMSLRGYVRAPTTGLWEFEFRTRSALTVRFGEDEVLVLEEAPASGRAFVYAGLTEGWHEVSIETRGKGAGRVSVSVKGPTATRSLGNGSLAWIPEGWKRPSPVETVLASGGEDARPAFDGNRGGRGVAARDAGLGVQWKKTERNLCGAILFPVRRRGTPTIPLLWSIETRTSTRGRWKGVKGARVLVCPGHEGPRKDLVIGPRYVVVLFDKASARQMRVRPGNAEESAPPLTEVEFRVLDKRRR